MDRVDEGKIAYFLEVLGVDINHLRVGNGKIILISGGTCSGKTSMARRIVQQAPQFKILNTGDFFREEAKKMGISLGELIRVPGEDLMKLDKAVDSKIIRYLAETDESLILTSRFAALWAEVLKKLGKPSLSIFLSVDTNEKLSRMAYREFKKGRFELTETEALKVNEELKRDERDHERYEKLYNLNPLSFYKYAQDIDTSNMTEKEVWGKLIEPLGSYIIGDLKAADGSSRIETLGALRNI
jgi:cytidylate kinase